MVVNAVGGDGGESRVLHQRKGPQRPPQGQRVLQVGRATVQLLQLQLEHKRVKSVLICSKPKVQIKNWETSKKEEKKK